MVVGVWELVLFLWSHPIISCMFLMLFSPPFFPVIVYFSPLLICTGLVAVAMVSMNMGERAAESEDWRNGTRGRLHEAAVHHVEMMPLKPARESWLEWMKNKEEKVKAWVDSRFLNQNKWQFRTRSALVAPEDEGMSVDLDSCDDEDYQIASYSPTPVRTIRLRPTPILTSLVDIITPPQTESEVLPPLAEAREAGPPVRVAVEDSSFTFPSLEQRSVPSFEVPLATAEEEVLKGEIVVPSTAKEGEPLSAVKAQAVSEKEILSAPKAESLVEEETPILNSKSEPRTSDATAAEVAILLLQEVLLPRVDDVSESRSLGDGVPEEKDGLLVTKHETTVEAPESILFREESILFGEESFAFAPHGDRAAKIEALLVGLGAVSGGDAGIPVSLGAVQNAVVDDDETRDVQPGADLHGSRFRAVEVLVSPEFSAASLGEDRKASPEAEAETSFFIRSNPPDVVVVQHPERFIGTEKIIFVDEPSKFTTATVQSRSMAVAEAAEEGEQMETRSIIQKAIEQMVALDAAENPPSCGSKSLKKDRSSEDDGLDENIESTCGNTPPPSTTTSRSSSSSSAAAVVLLQQNSEQQMAMALVRRSVSDGALTAETSALVPVFPQPNSLELLAENMEPIMVSSSSVYNDTALSTSSSVVLDKSFSLNTTFRAGGGAGGEEHDDLTARFHALKKSMSVHTTRRWEQQQQEQPISLLRAAAADAAATNAAVVPVYVPVPDVSSRVDSAPFPESLVLPEKSKSRPRVHSGNLESVEALTARLLTKFTPNIGTSNNTPFTRPPSRPVPALPAAIALASAAAAQSEKSLEIAAASSVESDKDKTPAIAPDESLGEIAPAPGVSEPVVSEKSVEGTENPVPLVDGDAATTVKGVEGAENLVVPLVGVATLPVTPVKNSLSSKKSLTSFLSRRREKLMSSTLMEAFSNSGDGERLGKKVVSSGKAAADTAGGTSIEIAAAAAADAAVEDRDEGSTTTATSGRQLKEKMISPLKRVFSMDANSGSGSSDRKGDSSQPSPAKASPGIREKQSVIDRSRGKFKKLFSSEGGAGAGDVTKLEEAEVVGKVAVLEKISLRKSKSKSAASKTEERNVELGDIQERNAELGDIPERNAELGDIQERNAELGDEQNAALAKDDVSSSSSTTTPKFEPQSDAAANGIDAVQDNNTSSSTTVRKPSDADNGVDTIQDDVSSSTTTPKLEHPSDAENGVDAVQDDMSSSTKTPKLEPPSYADDKIDAGVQSEKEQLSPGIEAALSLAETPEEMFISKSGPLLSSAPIEETMPAPVEEEVFIISKSEPLKSSAPPTEETMPPPVIKTGESGALPKDTARSKVTKSSSSSEKKFSWSWTKKKRCSDPIGGESVDRFRSPERSASWSSKGIEEESRVILMSPLTRFHSSSAIMSPVNEENAHTGGAGGPWDENHSGEFRFSQPDFPTSNHRHPPNADSSPFKRSPSSWWSPKTAYPLPPVEQVETVENVVEVQPVEKATPPKLKKVSSSWWSRKHSSSRADSKAMQSSDSKAVRSSSSPPDLPPTGSSNNITAEGIEKTWWTRKNRRADSNTAVQSSSPNPPPTENSTPPHGIVKSRQSSSPPDFPPRDIISGNNNYIPHGIEKSGPLFPLSAVVGDENTARDYAAAAPVDNRSSLQNDLLGYDDDEVAEVAPRPRHRRERSESLPSRATFSRLRGRQTSLSEITLPRTPELMSPASSSGRATDYNNTSGICTTRTTSPFSMSRTDGEQQYHHHHHQEQMKEKRNGDHHTHPLESSSSSSNAAAGGWRPSSIRTLDLANEQLRGGSPLFHHRSSSANDQLRSPFHRNSDRDVNGSGGYRNSPSAGAEIRITDKLKVPLEEVLSLLSTGDSDELQQHLPTAGSKPAGRAVASDPRRAASSSSSEEETSSEEEWSATSEDEDESQQQQQQQQPQLLQQQQQQFTTAGRIRRRLPHYIFSRGEATAS